MDKQEIWKDICGYERYSVSSFGRVRSNLSGKVLSARVASNGYLRVNVRKGAIKYEKPTVLHVHRLVAEAFVPRDNERPCVNHIDGDKTNNRADNLEWVTSAENTAHALRTGLMRPDYSKMNTRSRVASNASHNTQAYRTKMQMINQAKGLTKVVQQVDMHTGEVLREFDNCNEAARQLFGEKTLNDRLISRCARGQCRSAYGYHWRYKQEE